MTGAAVAPVANLVNAAAVIRSIFVYYASESRWGHHRVTCFCPTE